MTEEKHKERKREEENKSDALAALEAHFQSTFDVDHIKPVKASKHSDTRRKKRKTASRDADEEQEYNRTMSNLDRVDKDGVEKITFSQSASKPPSKSAPETVIFGQTADIPSTSFDRGNRRKFMSSKIDTREQKDENSLKKQQASQRIGTEQEQEEEEAMLSNDRELSSLLSTTLFAPGAQDERRANGKRNLGSNDTLARLMELGKPTLTNQPRSDGRGLGASMLKAQNMGRMPANMRHGMRRVEAMKNEKSIAREKELGNYHHSIKGLVGTHGRQGTDLIMGTKDKDRAKRTRQRGLGMGLGSFQNGTLKLSEKEVARINGTGKAKRGKH